MLYTCCGFHVIRPEFFYKLIYGKFLSDLGSGVGGGGGGGGDEKK